MNSPKVKICGISNIEILKTLISLDLDFIGFIFYSKSPRYIDTKFLQSIEDLDFKNSRPVCVYVNADEDLADTLGRTIGLECPCSQILDTS